MKYGLNFDETDSNYMLLNEIFKIMAQSKIVMIQLRFFNYCSDF